MISISIALVLITTEILLTVIYLKNKSIKPIEQKQNLDELYILADKVKSLEDQLSSVRLSISMRRKDG